MSDTINDDFTLNKKIKGARLVLDGMFDSSVVTATGWVNDGGVTIEVEDQIEDGSYSSETLNLTWSQWKAVKRVVKAIK